MQSKPDSNPRPLSKQQQQQHSMHTKPSVQIVLHVMRHYEKGNSSTLVHTHSFIHKHGLYSQFSVESSLVLMLVEDGNLSTARHVLDSSRLPCRSRQSWNSLIHGYLKCGDSRHALLLYSKMREESVIPSDSVVSALLKACAKLKDVENGRQIHAHIDGTRSLESNAFVGTSLMDMYSKCGMIDQVRDVFDRISVRDVVSWNALISGYGLHDRYQEALECFQHMQCQGIIPDEVSFACSLKACGSIGAVAIAKCQNLHAEIEMNGMLKTSQNVGNALVDMYAKCGSLEKAKEVFDLLPVRDIVSWNALICGCVQHEQGEEALNQFKKMQLQGISGDEVTYACILKACGCIRSSNVGQEIHFDAEWKGLLKTSQLVGNALVDMYSKCGMLTKAKAVFDKLPLCDTVTWNTLITGYVHCEHDEEALNAFEQMQRQRISPNSVTFACSLKACASIGAIEKGREIHAKIKEMGMLKRNQVVGNALVDLYAKCGVLEKAREVFDMLPARNIVSWNVLITGYGQVGEIENVFSVLDQMRGNGILPNPVTFLVVLNACSHTGMVDKGQTYCEAMTGNYGIYPLVGHQICMVDLFSRAGQLDEAVELVKKTPSHPSTVMWLTMLGACRNWGNVELGKQAFEETMSLDESHVTAYVSMYNIYADADVVL